MWEMFDAEIDCGTECGGSGPPPKFFLPPPPKPPFVQCSEHHISDVGVCNVAPFLDPSFRSSPLLQTSALIALCSVALVLIALISGLVIWKMKRKLHLLSPCKTSTRNEHLHHTELQQDPQHANPYEDPDAHLGHSPLVLRQLQIQYRNNENLEHLNSKGVRLPPLFLSTSPGPDPYRSHDNVYEELGPSSVRCDSDADDTEQASHSDDEFAEDELSLPGECSFQTSQKMPHTSTGTLLGTPLELSQSAAASMHHHPPPQATVVSTAPQTWMQQQTPIVSTIYKQYPNLVSSSYIDGRIVGDNNSFSNHQGPRNGDQQRRPYIHAIHAQTQGRHYPSPGLYYSPTVACNSTSNRRLPASAATEACCGRAPSHSYNGASLSLNRLMNPSGIFRGRKIHSGRGTKPAKPLNNNNGGHSTMSLGGKVYYNPVVESDRLNNGNHNNNEHLLPKNCHSLNCTRNMEDGVERRNRINRELSSMHTIRCVPAATSCRCCTADYAAAPPTTDSLLGNGTLYAEYSEPYQQMVMGADQGGSEQRTGGSAGQSQDYLRDSSFGSDSGYSQNTQISHRSGNMSQAVGSSGIPSEENSTQGSWQRSSHRNIVS